MLCGSYQSFVEFVRMLYDCHMICVEHVWMFCGTYVVVVWKLYECSVEHVWMLCGSHVNIMWKLYRTCV